VPCAGRDTQIYDFSGRDAVLIITAPNHSVPNRVYGAASVGSTGRVTQAMKKSAFLFVLAAGLLTIPAASAQSRFSLAPTVSYDVQTIRYEARSNTTDQTFRSWSRYSGFRAGLTGHYTVTPRWSVSLGVLYSRLTGTGTFFNTYTYVGPGSQQPAPVFQEYALKIASERIQMPVSINYTGSTGRLSPYLSAGLLVSHNYTRRVDALSDLPTQATVGAGLLYRFSPRAALIVQPTLGYELGKPDGSPFFSYPAYRVVQAGVQTQVKVTF
jgi:hypothetical protein